MKTKTLKGKNANVIRNRFMEEMIIAGFLGVCKENGKDPYQVLGWISRGNWAFLRKKYPSIKEGAIATYLPAHNKIVTFKDMDERKIKRQEVLNENIEILPMRDKDGVSVYFDFIDWGNMLMEEKNEDNQ